RGDYLADEGERGVVAEVWGPGNYRLNPYAYSWELVNAVEVGEKQVGVKTLKAGRDVSQLKGERGREWDGTPYVVPEGYRGVQEKTLPPGTHSLNPYVSSVVAGSVSTPPPGAPPPRVPRPDPLTMPPPPKTHHRMMHEQELARCM